MRKRVAQNSGDLWTRLPPDGREQIKAKLPDLILVEPSYVNLIENSYSRHLMRFEETLYATLQRELSQLLPPSKSLWVHGHNFYLFSIRLARHS